MHTRVAPTSSTQAVVPPKIKSSERCPPANWPSTSAATTRFASSRNVSERTVRRARLNRSIVAPRRLRRARTVPLERPAIAVVFWSSVNIHRRSCAPARDEVTQISRVGGPRSVDSGLIDRPCDSGFERRQQLFARYWFGREFAVGVATAPTAFQDRAKPPSESTAVSD